MVKTNIQNPLNCSTVMLKTKSTWSVRLYILGNDNVISRVYPSLLQKQSKPFTMSFNITI